MKKIILILFIFTSFIDAKNLKMNRLVWENGENFLSFLQKNSIPLSIYHNLDKEDKELTAEIIAGVEYQTLVDENNNIEQVLIPISEELQIQIYKDENDKYALTFTPVSYKLENDVYLAFKLQKSAYQDIVDITNNKKLTSEFLKAYNNSVNFKGMKRNDNVAIIYSQKRRLGKLYGSVDIKAVVVEVNKKPFYIFKFSDDEFYDENGRQLQSYTFILPVGNARISSPFNPGRFHPILKKYRAHLGIDYAVPTGTPIKAAASGKVTFKGVKGGYGNVVQISHNNSYMTLYAHVSRFAKIKTGDIVKQGQVIAYVGSTGLSTGPHLHFGMYKDNKAINPAKVVKIETDKLSGKQKAEFKELVRTYKNQLQDTITEGIQPKKEIDFEDVIKLN